MKLVRRFSLSRAFAGIAVAFAAACGGGEDVATEGANAATSELFPPTKETAGAEINIPGENTTTNENGSTAAASEPTGGAASESSTGNSTPPIPADPPGTPGTPGGPGTPTTPAPTPPKTYVPPECNADCIAANIPQIITAASKKYNIPRWFYFAVIRRESTFDRCKTQPESAPSQDWGRGLTQVTFPWYAGVPYPQHLPGADNNQSDWRYNMGLTSFGPWIDMKDITPIPATPASEADCRTKPKPNDAYDPKTNIDRFSTGFAAPAFHLYRVAGEAPEATLRRVAYHWHYGLWGSKAGPYPADPRPYLTCATCYDTHVKQYKAAVEAEDGVWTGPTCKPPYKDSGC